MDYNKIYSDELCHHGIKGQKWGVRRYQNKDGSLKTAGKKRLSSAVIKKSKTDTSIDKTSTTNYVIDTLQSFNSERINTMISDIRGAKKKWKDVHDKLPKNYEDYNEDYYESWKYDYDISEAYTKTVKWFKDNNPKYYNEILKLNNGDDGTLDKYDAFKSKYSENVDKETSKGAKLHAEKLKKLPKYEDVVKNIKKEEILFDQFYKILETSGKEIVGYYGDKPLKNYNHSYIKTVKDAVNNALSILAGR